MSKKIWDKIDRENFKKNILRKSIDKAETESKMRNCREKVERESEIKKCWEKEKWEHWEKL